MLVTAIMPTRGRAEFAAQAVACWQAQTWEPRELVIVDDLDDQSFPNAPVINGVRYHLLGERITIGAKRNLGCSLARGDVIAHWDDDDWSAPTRVEDQVQRLIETGAPITGYHSMVFRLEDGRSFLYTGNSRYALGTSLCYWRAWWEKNKFRDVNEGEDNHMVLGQARRLIVSVPAGDLMWARKHAGNTSDKPCAGINWKELACA